MHQAGWSWWDIVALGGVAWTFVSFVFAFALQICDAFTSKKPEQMSVVEIEEELEVCIFVRGFQIYIKGVKDEAVAVISEANRDMPELRPSTGPKPRKARVQA